MNLKSNRAIKWLSSAHFTVDAYSGFINPILPFIATKLGISMAIAAIMISVSNLTSSISQPLFGFVADKLKKRFFVFWGLLFASIFLSLVGVAHNVYVLALCIILGSMGVSFFHPQATSFVAFYSSKENASKEMSFYIALGTLGFACGPIISSTITEHFGLSALPFASIIGLLFASTMFMFVPKISMTSFKVSDNSLIEAFIDMGKNSVMRILLLTSILKSLIGTSFNIILPFYWKNQGYSVAHIGVLLFLFMLFGGLGIVASPIIEKKFGAKRVFYLSMIVVFPLALIFYFLQGKCQILSMLAYLLIGFISFLSVPLNMVMAQRTMPQYKSMISGFIGGFSWGVIGLLLPAVTWLAQTYGILEILLAISAVPMLFAYLVKYLPEEY